MHPRPSLHTLHDNILEHLRTGQYDAAAKALRTLLLLLPPEHEARVDLLVVLAFSHVEAGDHAEGFRIASHAVTSAPNHALARRQLVRARQAATRFCSERAS